MSEVNVRRWRDEWEGRLLLLLRSKRIVVFLLFIALLAVVWIQYQSGHLSVEFMKSYVLRNRIGGTLLFFLIYAAVVFAALPSLPLNLAAGYLWGGFTGGLIASVCVTLGGYASFMMSRSVLGQPLARHVNSAWLAKVQEEFARNGWKFVAFARINPIIPTGPLNYLLGLTSLSSRGFLAPTFCFLLPPSIAVAYVGDILQTVANEGSDVRNAIQSILFVSLAVTIVVAIRFFAATYKNRAKT